jgi:site-specific DNA recombinase
VDEELWTAVQVKLTGNLKRRRQARIESGAILRGLIFDGRGNRMSPTYTMRRGSRYRYYVSQAQLRGNREGSRPRIGADDVERLIVERLSRRQERESLAPKWLAASGARRHAN